MARDFVVRRELLAEEGLPPRPAGLVEELLEEARVLLAEEGLSAEGAAEAVAIRNFSVTDEQQLLLAREDLAETLWLSGGLRRRSPRVPAGPGRGWFSRAPGLDSELHGSQDSLVPAPPPPGEGRSAFAGSRLFSGSATQTLLLFHTLLFPP